jgi:membrane protein required for colicin V production
MNAADYVILTVLGFSTLTSLMRGFVAEVMSLAVWAIALWVSATTSGVFATTFLSGIEQPAVRLGSAYLAVFLLVLIAGGMCTWFIRKMITKSGLGSTDRTLGALFGFTRGLLIVFSAVLFAGFTAIPQQPLWRESALLPTITRAAGALGAYLPASVRDYLRYPSAAVPTPERTPEPDAAIDANGARANKFAEANKTSNP